ncbi:MAG: hypothetical protein ACI843_001999, partial [Psychrobacter glaciei]
MLREILISLLTTNLNRGWTSVNMAKNLILWLIIATVLLAVFKQLDTPVS